jgi:hypothetical protein
MPEGMHATQIYRALVVGLLGAIALQIAVLPGELRPRPEPAAEPPRAPAVLHVQRDAVGSIDRKIAAMIGQPVVAVEVVGADGERVRVVIDEPAYWSVMPRLAQ